MKNWGLIFPFLESKWALELLNQQSLAEALMCPFQAQSSGFSILLPLPGSTPPGTQPPCCKKPKPQEEATSKHFATTSSVLQTHSQHPAMADKPWEWAIWDVVDDLSSSQHHMQQKRHPAEHSQPTDL